MARKKVKLEWISSDTARRATMKKRRKGLLKKVAELSTLCDVKACIIVYAPIEPQPEVWPSPIEATRVLAKLSSLPEMEQSKKMMNQEGFMRHRIAKLQEQLGKQDRENRELETKLLMYQVLKGRSMGDLDIRRLTRLAWLIELKMKEVQKRMASFAYSNIKKELPPEMMKEEAPLPMTEVREKTALQVAVEELQRQEWLSEIMNQPHDEIMGDHHASFFENVSAAWLDSYFPKN